MENQNLIRNLNGNKQTNNAGSSNAFALPGFLVLLVGFIIVGLLVGFVFSKLKSPSVSSTTSTESTTKNNATSAGIADTKTFPDKAQGTLKEGGIEGEGSHHIEQKPGDASQNVYLTSTTVDLSQFVGKKVRVMGKTYQAQHAGWLMDVGYIEVIK